MAWLRASGDIASAATALGGLLLVFMGAITTSFDSYRAQDQDAVRPKFKKRAKQALVGFLFALLAALLGIVGKIFGLENVAISAAVSLAFSFILVCVAALTTYWDLG